MAGASRVQAALLCNEAGSSSTPFAFWEEKEDAEG